MFRVEVFAAAVAVGGTWQVRFQALGACREHQPEVRLRISTAGHDAIGHLRALIRPKEIARWAAAARDQLLAHAVLSGTVQSEGEAVATAVH